MESMGRIQRRAARRITYPGQHAAPLKSGDLFDDLFTPIARDGAGLVEVGLRLQKALATLSELGPEFREHATRHSKEALARAAVAMQLDADMGRLRASAFTSVDERRP
jgi:uncharacterized membrane protein